MFRKTLLVVVSLLWASPLFAQSVDTAWVRRYNGSTESVFEVWVHMAINDSGNVYVAGRSWDDVTNDDYVTIKYYPNGDTAWVRKYNGPGSLGDEASAIAVDSPGNVYVTGYTWSGMTGRDYTTIKYYPNGDTAWVRRYNGPANQDDIATSLAVDPSSNIYVTGMSNGSGTREDYATIKYYPNGDTAWVRRYNGTGDSMDFPNTIAVDGSGNVYVTGKSWDSVTMEDYATIKYYPDGDTAWVRRYNGPASLGDEANAIAIDDSGNVYVTGISMNSETDYNAATIKYYPNGDTAWVRRYDGGGNAIALDNSNHIYVAGGIAVSVDTFSNIPDADGGLIKYYPNGDTIWIRRYNGPGDSTDIAFAIAVDSSDNVYVIGPSWGSGTGFDYATIKYYPNGDTAWVIRYNGPDNSDDIASDMAVDNSGNVYVTGPSWGSGLDFDYATIKYVQFLRGDANKDGSVDIIDVVYLVNYVLKSGFAPDPIPQVGDANCDDKVDIIDAVYLVNYLFKSGTAPCE